MSWACVGCGKFAFPEDGVRCYWCTNAAPVVQPEVKKGRPTWDELKLREQALKYGRRKKRERGAG